MKELLIIITMMVACLQLTNAQVKNQFQDDIYAQTTIVVKEDSASDVDILNDQFDLDEIGMGQVIKITTAPAKKEEVQKEVQLAEATPKKEPIRNSKKIVPTSKKQKAVAEQPTSTKKTVAKKSTVKTTKSVSSKSTRTYSKKRSTKKKSFKLFKTNKKQKRKKYSKRKRSKCYRF